MAKKSSKKDAQGQGRDNSKPKPPKKASDPNGVNQGSKSKSIPKSSNSNAMQSSTQPQQQPKSQKQPKTKVKASSSSWLRIFLGLFGVTSLVVAGVAVYMSEDAQEVAGNVYSQHVGPVVMKARNFINDYFELQTAEGPKDSADIPPSEDLINEEKEKMLKEKEERERRDEEERERQENERKAEVERTRKLKEEAEKKAEQDRKERERKEEEERKRKEKEEAERKAEEERKEKERKAEEERKKREKEEAERKAELDRKEKLRKDEEERKRKEKEEAQRKEKEEERKRKEKEEAERKERERKEEEERKKKEKEEADKKAEKERKEKEQKEAEERKKKEKEEANKKAEKEQKEAEERKKKEKEEADKKAEKERKEKEQKEAEERKKKEKEEADKEAEKERKEKDQKEAEERKKKEKEEAVKKAEKERKEKEQKEAEERKRKEKEEADKKAEKERREKEQKEAEERKRKEKEEADKKAEKERKEKEQKEAEERKRKEKEEADKKAEELKKSKETKVGTESQKKNEEKPEIAAKEEVSKENPLSQKQEKEDEVYEFASITNVNDFKIKDELDEADRLYDEDDFEGAIRKYDSILRTSHLSPRAMYGKGLTLDKLGFKHQSNEYLEQAINFLGRLLLLPDVPDELFLMAGRKLAERQHFRGWGGKAVKTFTLMLERFPEDIKLRCELGVTYMLIGRNEQAKDVFEQVLQFDPDSGFAKAHIGFIYKTANNNLEKAIPLLRDGIESGEEGTSDGRFYIQLGDALIRLGQLQEARHYFEEAEQKGLFLSQWQRSLYNVKELTGRPFWTAKQLGYEKYIQMLEKNWKTIRDEGLAQLDEKSGSFLPEEENLRDTGEWKQFTLYQQGRKNKDNCDKVPKTCALIDQMPPAAGCKRGQVKFSVMSPGIHVWPHTGPTNCRLRSHLGLVVPDGPVLRVVNETRTWTEGKVMTFDDSFEHEVWHKGTKWRLILIVDFWHPELTERQRRTLSPI